MPLRAVHHQLDGLVQGVAPGVQPRMLSVSRRKPGVRVEEDEVPALVPLPPGQGCDRVVHLPQGLGFRVTLARRWGVELGAGRWQPVTVMAALVGCWPIWRTLLEGMRGVRAGWEAQTGAC